MILNGAEILSERDQDRIIISPFNPENIGPNSYDVTLGTIIKRVEPNEIMYHENGDPYEVMYPKKKQSCVTHEMDDDGIVIQPNKLYLAHTVERVGSEYYVPMLEGRSSIGRMGLFIHVTAGFGDIGFMDQWTLELYSIYPIKIYPGMRIAQVFFHECSSQSIMYQGRYQGQVGPQESLFYKGRM